MVFFAILSVGVYRIIASQLNLTKVLEERGICPYLAKAACTYAQLEVLKDETSYDTLFELAVVRKRTLGNGEFIYTILDEGSKININSTSSEILARLPGLNTELAQQISNSKLLPFNLKEEVLLVEGVTEEIFLEFKDFITVYTDGKININTAGTTVLSTLGLDQDLVTKIEDFRKGPDNQEATEDDGVFENTDEILDKLRAFAILTGEQEAKLLSLISQGLFTVEAGTMSLEIETKISHRPALRYSIILDREKIKEWREY